MHRSFGKDKLYKQLFHGPLAINQVIERGFSVSEFVGELEQEGAILEQKDGFLNWKKWGFGANSLSARFAHPVLFSETCHSTNDWARESIEREEKKEGVFVCTNQLAGRGRLGREWICDVEDSLVCSFVCRPTISVEHVSLCSLVWMAEIAHHLGLYVKWPNDVMSASGKKIGGCLTELVDNEPTIIFGLGINVGHKKAPLETASSLFLEGKYCPREDVLALVYEIVFAEKQNFSLDRWKSCALYMGQKIRVQDIEGVMTGIRDDGALLVDGAPILTGDVELVEDRRCSW